MQVNQKTNVLQPQRGLSLPFTFVTASSPHPDHLECNEDYLAVDRRRGLAVICDGVGSAIGAEQAAYLAARTIKSYWRQIHAQSLDMPPWSSAQAEMIRQLLEAANKEVLALGKCLTQKQENCSEQSEKKGPSATTIALALLCCHQTDYRMLYGHAGDSRIYLLRRNEALRRLTTDDGYFLLAQEKGELDEQTACRIEQASSTEQLSEEELEHFKKRNGITQSLGCEVLSIHMGELELCPGDRILLCTDGIHDNLTDREIEAVLRKGARTTVAKTLLQQACVRALQDEASCMRAKKDDMSAIVITYHCS